MSRVTLFMLCLTGVFEIPLELGALVVLSPSQVAAQREIANQTPPRGLWQDRIFAKYPTDKRTEINETALFLRPEGGLVAVLASYRAHLAIRGRTAEELSRISDAVDFEIRSSGRIHLGDLADVSNDRSMQVIDLPAGTYSGRLLLLDTRTDAEPVVAQVDSAERPSLILELRPCAERKLTRGVFFKTAWFEEEFGPKAGRLCHATVRRVFDDGELELTLELGANAQRPMSFLAAFPGRRQVVGDRVTVRLRSEKLRGWKVDWP